MLKVWEHQVVYDEAMRIMTIKTAVVLEFVEALFYSWRLLAMVAGQ